MQHRSVRLTVAFVCSSAAAVAARTASAQTGGIDPACGVPASGNPLALAAAVAQQDACQKAVDLANFLAPQLGALVAGGSAGLGRGGSLGGLGHFDVGLRGTLVGAARVPNLSDVPLSFTGAQRTDLALDRRTLALPALDVGVGLFAGFPVGLTRVGGVDLLLTGGYVPSISSGEVRVRRNGRALQVGYGGRLGLLERSRFVPGLGVTFLHRALPPASILANTNNGGQIGVVGTRISTNSWRVAADQRFSIFSLNAGVGQDRYNSRGTLAAAIPLLDLPGLGTVVADVAQPFRQQLTRTNVYAGVSLPATGFAQLAAEVGRASGGRDIATYNGLSGRAPNNGYTYVTLGVRVGR